MFMSEIAACLDLSPVDLGHKLELYSTQVQSPCTFIRRHILEFYVLPVGEVSARRTAYHPCRFLIIDKLRSFLTVSPEVELPWVTISLDRAQV